MSAPQHTSAPWEVGAQHETKVEIVSGDVVICTVHEPALFTPKQMKANAALITAAPDLLALSARLLETVDHDGMFERGVLEALRATVAKARGGT